MVTSGRDGQVRLYDEETKGEPWILESIEQDEPAHTQWVFATKFMREDQNLVLTGGWDRTIKLFDLRAGGPVAHFFGAELSADSLD